MYEFDYELENFNLYGEPCKVIEMIANCDTDPNQSIEDRKNCHDEYDGYEKFSCVWAVHKENGWTGMLILDVSKLDGNYIIATGIGY
jgi:hypothetical protein